MLMRHALRATHQQLSLPACPPAPPGCHLQDNLALEVAAKAADIASLRDSIAAAEAAKEQEQARPLPGWLSPRGLLVGLLRLNGCRQLRILHWPALLRRASATAS